MWGPEIIYNFNKIIKLASYAQNSKTEEELLVHLRNYKQILSILANKVLITKNEKDKLLPYSEHARCHMLSLLIRQSIKTNGMFSKLPGEINAHILSYTTNLTEQESNTIYYSNAK